VNEDTYIHTYVYMYVPWVIEYVTKTTGCGTVLKYINIQDVIVQNTINILYSSIEHHLYIQTIRSRSKSVMYLSIFLSLI